MSWDKEPEKSATSEGETPKEEPTPAAEPATEPPKEEPKVEVQGESKETPKPEPMVPQKLIGQVAKKIRDESRARVSEKDAEIARLQEENRKLKDGDVPQDSEEDQRITQKVRIEFLKRQDAYGREKYGQDYLDALDLVAAQKDPVLVSKIQGAASPADMLMKEATRIAEEIEFGSDPQLREQKKLETLKSTWRSEWEKEYAEKLKARGNQPTDVSSVRTAGGDAKPKYRPESWETSLRK